MEFDEKDEVIQILTKMKNANGAYPPDMLAARRQDYLKQMAELGIGVGAGTALKQALQNGSGASAPAAGPLSTLLETVLVIAIVAEAGAVAYINRSKLINLFQSNTKNPTAVEVTTAPALISPLIEISFTSTPILTETVTPIGTPSPSLLANPLQPTDNSSAAGSQANATPDPTGNNGNQYGLTPKPERTKKPGNSQNSPNDKNPTPHR